MLEGLEKSMNCLRLRQKNAKSAEKRATHQTIAVETQNMELRMKIYRETRTGSRGEAFPGQHRKLGLSSTG